MDISVRSIPDLESQMSEHVVLSRTKCERGRNSMTLNEKNNNFSLLA